MERKESYEVGMEGGDIICNGLKKEMDLLIWELW